MKRREFITLLAGLPVVGKYLKPQEVRQIGVRQQCACPDHIGGCPNPSSIKRAPLCYECDLCKWSQEYTMTVSNTDSVLWINPDGQLMVTDGREWDNLCK